jgi:hypothetical protein
MNIRLRACILATCAAIGLPSSAAAQTAPASRSLLLGLQCTRGISLGTTRAAASRILAVRGDAEVRFGPDGVAYLKEKDCGHDVQLYFVRDMRTMSMLDSASSEAPLVAAEASRTLASMDAATVVFIHLARAARRAGFAEAMCQHADGVGPRAVIVQWSSGHKDSDSTSAEFLSLRLFPADSASAWRAEIAHRRDAPSSRRFVDAKIIACPRNARETARLLRSE